MKTIEKTVPLLKTVNGEVTATLSGKYVKVFVPGDENGADIDSTQIRRILSTRYRISVVPGIEILEAADGKYDAIVKLTRM